MDSLLSNAQRCARKADSLVKYGLYDEALGQLDKSIAYLNELKAYTTRYENIQMLNVQIESIDRKKRSVAIKRSESLKKKSRIETLINKTRASTTTNIAFLIEDHDSRLHTNAANLPNKSINKVDQSPVIIEYCFNDQTDKQPDSPGSVESDSMFVHGRKKLDKDEKSIIEELSTTNAEYKKVNTYLANEIEQLKQENDFLKIELIKLHMSDSLTSSDSSMGSGVVNNENREVYHSSSTPISQKIQQSVSLSSLAAGRSMQVLGAAFINCSNTDNSMHTVPYGHVSSGKQHKLAEQRMSSASSSASSSSWSISTSSHPSSSQKPAAIPSNYYKNTIDLSKYMDDDDDGDDDKQEENVPNQYYNEYDLYQNTDDDSDLSAHNPPLEFPIDSL